LVEVVVGVVVVVVGSVVVVVTGVVVAVVEPPVDDDFAVEVEPVTWSSAEPA
jgi:hypothetical protein